MRNTKKTRKPLEVTFGYFLPPANSKGFTYVIRFKDGYYYYGCKLIDIKGTWKKYRSSSDYVKARLHRIPASYQVLQWHYSKCECKFYEQKLIDANIKDEKNLNYGRNTKPTNLAKLYLHLSTGVV